MAMDSVELVRDAEQRAQQLVADARREAAGLINAARAEGRRQHDETMAGAQAAAKDTLESARIDGIKRRETDKKAGAEQGAQLKKQAEARREQAVRAVLSAITGE